MELLGRFDRLAVNTISTVAGAGYRLGAGAKDTRVGRPGSVVRRPNGDLVVADYHAHCLWRIDTAGILHRFAGDTVPGDSGEGGPAAGARFRHPHDLFQDQAGNIYFTDVGNEKVFKIDYRTAVLTRVAGCGRPGRGGDGGPATDAELDLACGVAVDAAGNVYLCGLWDSNVRRVDAATGIIETFAGRNARHYPSERGASRPYAGPGLSLMGYHGDGGPASEAAFHHPEHLAFDSSGDLYVCDNMNHRIRKIDMGTGTVTTVFGTGRPASNGDGGPAVEADTLEPDAIFIDVHDNLYVGEKGGFRVRRVDAGTGTVTTLVGTGVPGFGEEGLPGPQTTLASCEAGMWADPDGTVLWGDCSGRIRRCDGRTGIVTTLLGGTSVGDGGPAAEAFLCAPRGICAGADGQIYIADMYGQRVRAIDPHTGAICTVAGNGARAYGGDNGPATAAYLGAPNDVSVDSRGRVVITDAMHAYLRRVDEDGVIRVVAGTGIPWDKGDGGPALGACFVRLQAVAHGPGDDIYVGDTIGRVRRIDAVSGTITTVAGTGIRGYTGDGGPAVKARIGAPTALCLDGAGNLYITDGENHVVRRVDAKGTISTVAGRGEAGYSPDGTPARQARLNGPSGVAVGKEGVVYVSESGNSRVRRVDSDGTLRTVAGSNTPGDAGEGGPATRASLNEPHGLCLYRDDLLLISDFSNNRVKAVKLPAGW